MKKIETFLPVFTGFYETIFEPNEDLEMEYINEKRQEKGLEPLDWSSDVVFDYDQYNQDVSKGAVYFIEGELIELGLVKYIKFQKLYLLPKRVQFCQRLD